MFLLLLLLLLAISYLYSTRNFDYWNKRNVKHDPPLPLFGNFFQNAFGLKSLTEYSVSLYKKYPNEKVVGYYRTCTPELHIKDLDIARRILSVDFIYFHQRVTDHNTEREKILRNLFHDGGDRWKLLRQRLTPAFTTAKLKNMFPLVVHCAERLQSLGHDIVASGGNCCAVDLMSRFTIEFVGSCGFGITIDTISNENCLFKHLSKMLFKKPAPYFLHQILWEAFPFLRTYMKFFNNEAEVVLTNIVQSIRAQRNCKPSGRNDFVDLLLELEAKGKMEGESIENQNPDGTPALVEMEMDVDCMIAQMFIFFGAGFETSSSSTSFTLHKLAYHADLQTKIQNEIDRVLLKFDNKLCYDAISEMSLLGSAFKEALRMFPPLGVVTRVCTKTYTIPELNITINPGVKIIIPIQAIQNDEKYYKDPGEFRPERFHQRMVHQYSYMPFGEGPRKCIGARMGYMQSLAGMAAILHKFTVVPALGSREEIRVMPRVNTVQRVLGGLPIKLITRTPKAQHTE